MTAGDPLDRIEKPAARARGMMHCLPTADVLALVEVARAARPFSVDEPWWPPSEQDEYRSRLAAALARLDGPR